MTDAGERPIVDDHVPFVVEGVSGMEITMHENRLNGTVTGELGELMALIRQPWPEIAPLPGLTIRQAAPPFVRLRPGRPQVVSSHQLRHERCDSVNSAPSTPTCSVEIQERRT